MRSGFDSRQENHVLIACSYVYFSFTSRAIVETNQITHENNVFCSCLEFYLFLRLQDDFMLNTVIGIVCAKI